MKSAQSRLQIDVDIIVAFRAVPSMVLFGLYTGQRLSDIASLWWSNIDLPRGELRLVTRKTGKTMILPIAAPLRRLLESLPAPDDPNGQILAQAQTWPGAEIWLRASITASLSLLSSDSIPNSSPNTIPIFVSCGKKLCRVSAAQA